MNIEHIVTHNPAHKPWNYDVCGKMLGTNTVSEIMGEPPNESMSVNTEQYLKIWTFKTLHHTTARRSSHKIVISVEKCLETKSSLEIISEPRISSMSVYNYGLLLLWKWESDIWNKKSNINRYRANQQNSSMLPKGITDLDH